MNEFRIFPWKVSSNRQRPGKGLAFVDPPWTPVVDLTVEPQRWHSNVQIGKGSQIRRPLRSLAGTANEAERCLKLVRN